VVGGKVFARRNFDSIMDRSVRESLARTQLDRITGVQPEAIKAAYLVCHMLCEFAGVPFEYPMITVAKEKLSVNGIKALLSEEKLQKPGATS
jgi:hypothetical protein